MVSTCLKNMRKSHWIILSWIGVKVQKNVWNYHSDFHAKPHNPQEFGETEVTTRHDRRPVSQGTSSQLCEASLVRGEGKWPMFDQFLGSCCFRGGSESELFGNRLQSRLVVVVEVFSPYGSLLKGDEKKTCPISSDLQNSRKWKSWLWTNHRFPTV